MDVPETPWTSPKLWEKKLVTADLVLALPEGQYEVWARDENQWYRASIDGNAALAHTQLQKCRLTIEHEKPYVLYIRKANRP
ncbi:MAG: hypothetical protein ABSE73_21330 [Planctomycetota bacterium]